MLIIQHHEALPHTFDVIYQRFINEYIKRKNSYENPFIKKILK